MTIRKRAVIFAALVLLLAAGASLAKEERVPPAFLPAAPPAASEPTRDEIRILLAGFEHDEEAGVQEMLKADFLAAIQGEQRRSVNLSISPDRVHGVSLPDMARNACALGKRHGFDVVVFGGTSGSISTVSVTLTGRRIEGWGRFLGLGFTQQFQFHLDAPFAREHHMVADALFGIVDVWEGDFDRAQVLLQRAVDRDERNAFGLNIVRLYLGACRMNRLVVSGDAEAGRQAIRTWYRILDEIRPMSHPGLHGAVRASLAQAYLWMIDAAPDRAAVYRRKARASLENAIEELEFYPELVEGLAAQLEELENPTGDGTGEPQAGVAEEEAGP